MTDCVKNSNVNMYGAWWRDTIPQNILKKKYFHEEELKVAETDFDKAFLMFVERVAGIFPKDKDKIGEFVAESIIDGTFLPAGRTLYGAGAKGKFKASLSNCYILPSPEDNIESIFDTAKEMARIYSYGGGCGTCISKLRPKDAIVHNSAKTSSGAVSFMDVFNIVGEVIGNNGRRSALLIALDCTHPDIEEFLTVKQNNDKIQGANISIKFTDEFMKAVKRGEDVTLRFDNEEAGVHVERKINATEFFHKFAEAQREWCEPGALFIDIVQNWNLLSGYPKEDYNIEVTNPCAEFASNAYNSCNLGSINLYNFVKNPFTKEAEFDFHSFCRTVSKAVIAMDMILDYGYDMQPLDANRKCIDDWRSIGLGVFGLADMLVAMGLKYGETEAIRLIREIMYQMQQMAYITSARRGHEKGSFGKFDPKKFYASDMVDDIRTGLTAQVDSDTYGAMRNGTLLAIAPTGSISMLFRESGGVEPYYNVAYERTTHVLEKQGKSFHIAMLGVEHLLKSKGIEPGSISNDEIKAKFPFVVDTYDITPEKRVDLQATMQGYVDNAISSTINLKESTTEQEIFDLYVYAWEQGCKGITIFRDNCKRINIMGTDHGVKRKDVEARSGEVETPKITVIEQPVTEQEMQECRLDYLEPVKRGDKIKSLWGRTFVYHTACVKKFYVTVNVKDNDIFEVFVGADTGCQANISTITRLTSYALRLGGKALDIADELDHATCPACTHLMKKGDKTVNKSCASCIASAIKEMYKTLHGGKTADEAKLVNEMPPNKVTEKPVETSQHTGMAECPECHQKTLVPDGHCVSCPNCGYTKCS